MLEKVIKQKHGNRQAKTEKICRFFIDAIERSKYGWFWKCPNGEECIYKHSLPEGWKLRDTTNDKKNIDTMEDMIEKERTKLTGTLTPLTKDLFEAWKVKWLARMKNEKEDEMKQALAVKKKDKKFLDPNFKFLSGRSMFVFNADEELDDAGNNDDELQELIRNRKRVYDDDDEANANGHKDGDTGNDELIDDVELPDDDFGE